MIVNPRLILHTDQINKRFTPKYADAQKWLDNEVLKDSDKYVPFRTGNLRNSGIRGTNIGSGMVIYNAPYAARCYYGNFNFSKIKHPEACRQWFEKAKAANSKKWVNGARQKMRG